jgi:DNA invertase Pin-like site-specific DNA recombinase
MATRRRVASGCALVSGSGPPSRGREWRSAAREARRAHGQHIGRPKSLDSSKAALAQRMHASGESASTIAAALGVSRATVYRVLAEGAD